MIHSTVRYATLHDWIAQEAVPFSLASPTTFNAAVDKLIASLGSSVELLGFGEALHGGEELLLLRNQLFQRLVERHGYSAIAIESNFHKGDIVNEYVLGRGPDSYEAVRDAGLKHGFERFEANRELIEWMRQYNADPAHPVKIHFYGFDGPTDAPITSSPRQILFVALDYLTSIDRVRGQEYRNRIEPLLGQDAAWENPDAALDPTKAVGQSAEARALRIEVEELISELHFRRPELVAKSDKSRYLEAMQFAVEARQLLNYHAELARASDKRMIRLLHIRAGMMADNLEYIISREQGWGKVFIFAHNSHLNREQTIWQWGNETVTWCPVGAHLQEMFGSRYAVIGSAVGESPVHGIGRPEAGTLEALLTAVPGPARFIPTHGGQGLPAEEIAVLPVRSGSKKNGSYIEPLSAQSFSNFDWFAVLDTVTYVRGGLPWLAQSVDRE